MSKPHPSVVWFRRDLRLADNPALMAALEHGGPILPLFIWNSDPTEEWAMGAASRWWLHHSLSSLDQSLKSRGSRLIIGQGDDLDTLKHIIRQTGATAVYWNRGVEPSVRTKEEVITRHLEQMNITVKLFEASWLFHPDTLLNKSGDPYQMFTPFWTRCLAEAQPQRALAIPRALPAPPRMPASVSLSQLKLEPKLDWASGLRECWRPGEDGARQRLLDFLNEGMVTYDRDRDRPDLRGSSRLSPHLHFGEISPRQIWHEVQARIHSKRESRFYPSAKAFLRQLGWREFASHLLLHFPHMTTKPLREKFEAVPWKNHGAELKSWQRGETGYPIVDAGMRELWKTGWMHNRVRMIVASFLTKHLQITWQRGAEWFWDTLVDADLANNTLGWQWVAGCGADAAPYFRIFNPVTQGVKFDPKGEYVRRWVPELARLPFPWIHKPWEASPLLLKECGMTLGKTYPFPIVDHREARERAMRMFGALTSATSPHATRSISHSRSSQSRRAT